MTGGIVPIGAKPVTSRRAVARGSLVLKPSTVEAVEDGRVAKGDVLAAARVAALMAVKRTPDILPYCHPIPVTRADVEFETRASEGRVVATVTVEAAYRTGVEMEALAGVAVALLCVWDMVKPLEKDQDGQYPTARLDDVRVIEKVKW